MAPAHRTPPSIRRTLVRQLVGTVTALGLVVTLLATGVADGPAERPPTDAVATGSPDLSAAQPIVSKGCVKGARCWVKLNWKETKKFANGAYLPPGPTTSVWSGLWTIFVAGHRLIAKGWVSRGRCVVFTFSPVPWEGRGMSGYACPH